MKHYVFTAGYCAKNEIAIEAAKMALDRILTFWDVEALATNVYGGSKVIINEDDGGNYSIAFENDLDIVLINHCMDFRGYYVECYNHLINK